MKLTINGKVYGWNVIFDADIHRTTGTVIKHQFYKFRKRNGGYQWAAPTTFWINSTDYIAGWNVTGIRTKFCWGISEDFWKFED